MGIVLESSSSLFLEDLIPYSAMLILLYLTEPGLVVLYCHTAAVNKYSVFIVRRAQFVEKDASEYSTIRQSTTKCATQHSTV